MSKRWSDGRRLDGRIAVVTGAGGVLGGASARTLAREGAKVAVAYRNSRDEAEETVATILAAGGEAATFQLDVSDSTSVTEFIDAVVERLGGIDIVVNSAGRIDVADATRFADADVDGFSTLFDIDVLGTMRVCKAARPHLEKSGSASIINFSGSYGNGVNPDNFVNSVTVGYSSAKGAIRAFTASLARDFAPAIRVNAIAPGAIAADWDTDWGIPVEHVEEALAMTPLGRLGDPVEIAETVTFLASDGAGYITGQTIQVDGGWVMAG